VLGDPRFLAKLERFAGRRAAAAIP